ncbi:hypothetical protein HYZ78_00200 [Candidatus Microgenomates bacterium]|nr:hypothetical protein [Candidatus Microgenomates bacterium]
MFVTGNLTIQGRINLNDGDGFFMTIVGGNINVDDGVSHPNQPALEGAYFAGGNFATGTGGSANDDQLYIRGSVAASGSINLQRDLGDDNQTKPGEFIEFAPDLIFTYPRELGEGNFIWHEIAP